jgi:predicted nuclease with TOPRIM domain
MIKIMNTLFSNLRDLLRSKQDDSTKEHHPITPNPETVQTELIAARKKIELLEVSIQDIDNQRIAIQKEKEDAQKQYQELQQSVDSQKVYFTALDDRYGDFLKIARKTDESDPEQIKKLWHIVVAMSFHHYDYMKMICNDVNWREVQDRNIQLIKNQQLVADLPLDAYVQASNDPREIELHFRVLFRLLKQVGIEKLDDVLLSGVRI